MGILAIGRVGKVREKKKKHANNRKTQGTGTGKSYKARRV
jgi:hypothetical protein